MGIEDLLSQFLPAEGMTDVMNAQGGMPQGNPQFPGGGVPMPPPRPPEAPPPMQMPGGIPLPQPRPDSAPPRIQQPGGLDDILFPSGSADMPALPPRIAGGGSPSQQPQGQVPMPPPRPDIPQQVPQQAGVPLPPPRPPMPPAAALPASAAPTAGVTPPQPPGPPLSLTPPQQPGGPPLPPFAQPRPTPQMQVLTDKQKQMQQLVAGVSKGLAGIQGPGRFASFARGAGQGAQGSLAEGAQQRNTEDKQQGTRFNQLSTAFKDMLAAQNGGNTAELQKARAAFYTAQAQAVKNDPNTDARTRHVLGIEAQISRERIAGMKELRDTWKQGGIVDPAAQKKGSDELDQKLEKRRSELYSRTGIDPKEGEKMLTRGMQPPKLPNGQPNPEFNPYDTKNMTPEQFHSQVPIGSWYLNKDGTVLQRTKPPPGQQKSSVDRVEAIDTAGMQGAGNQAAAQPPASVDPTATLEQAINQQTAPVA